MNMSEEIIKLIEKFLSNSISQEEMYRLLRAYQEKQISEQQLEEYYVCKWNNAGQEPSSLARENKDKIWKQLESELFGEPRAIPKPKRRWILYASAAAVAVVFFVLGISLPQAGNHDARQELVVSVENGQKASVQLPDGSLVHLNSASQIRYSPDFGKKNRTVKLEGEAYFHVQSNPDNPFIVITNNNLEIKALGTKFNVRSYPNDQEIIGTLIEGKIQVTTPLLSEILKPKEQISFNTKEITFKKSNINNIEEALFWMTDHFVFEKETLENIAKILERMYNVTISFTSPEIKQIQYSGKIKNNSMENVLNLITVVSPLQYTMTDSHITFSKNSINNP